MLMGLREGQWTLLVSSCLRSTNRVNLCAREHAESQNIWIHPRILSGRTCPGELAVLHSASVASL